MYVYNRKDVKDIDNVFGLIKGYEEPGMSHDVQLQVGLSEHPYNPLKFEVYIMSRLIGLWVPFHLSNIRSSLSQYKVYQYRS